MSKRMKQAVAMVKADKLYEPAEAVKLVCQTVGGSLATKFSQSVDVALGLNVDPEDGEQVVRGIVNLPKGSGRAVKVAVFCTGQAVEAAKKAGADIVGGAELVAEVEGGKVAFDKCVSTPEMMPKVGRLGRVLGPKGMMPNPKLGTVTTDVAAAVKALKGGQLEFRAEKGGIIHCSLGRAEFKLEDLVENLTALYRAVLQAKPESVKGYVKNMHLSATMGPSVKVDFAKLGTR